MSVGKASMHGDTELAGHAGAVASSPWPVRAVTRVRCT